MSLFVGFGTLMRVDGIFVRMSESSVEVMYLS